MPAPSPLHLTAAFVPMSEAAAERAIVEEYGLSVLHLERLATERDDSFRVRDADGLVVVAKFAHPLDDEAALRDQIAVLDALARAHPDVPVPRVIPARDGALLTRVVDEANKPRWMRVLSYRDGEPLGAAPRSHAELQAIGVVHARLARAIAAIGDAATPALQGSPTPWNLLHVAQYGALVDHVPDAELRHAATRVIERAVDTVLPLARALPATLAHNDVHGDNVLVRTEPFTVTGVLDFGDMTRTPRVADVAVAASYARGRVGEAPEPWEAARVYVRGYETEQLLTDDEHALLPELVLLRLAQRAVLNSAIAAANPAARGYASRNLSAIARDLRELGASIPSTIGGPR